MPSPYDDSMRHALDEASASLASGDVPIGAVVLDAEGAVIGRGHNIREAVGALWHRALH